MALHPLWPHTISHRAITAVILTAGAALQLGRNQCLTSMTREELKGKAIRVFCCQVNASIRAPRAASQASLSVIVKKGQPGSLYTITQNMHASRGWYGGQEVGPWRAH